MVWPVTSTGELGASLLQASAPSATLRLNRSAAKLPLGGERGAGVARGGGGGCCWCAPTRLGRGGGRAKGGTSRGRVPQILLPLAAFACICRLVAHTRWATIAHRRPLRGAHKPPKESSEKSSGPRASPPSDEKRHSTRATTRQGKRRTTNTHRGKHERRRKAGAGRRLSLSACRRRLSRTQPQRARLRAGRERARMLRAPAHGAHTHHARPARAQAGLRLHCQHKVVRHGGTPPPPWSLQRGASRPAAEPQPAARPDA